VKTFDFKMVGNWPGQADGLEVHGKESLLQYTYLHIADDSMKVAADNVAYEYTTVLQGDVGTGGLIHLGSYGTGRGIASGEVSGVYVHRITQKPNTYQNKSGYFGAALVAALTCPYGNNVKGVKITDLRVNNLDPAGNINSVNRLFNIGLGTSEGGPCGDSDSTPTQVGDLRFEDFQIYVNPLSYSTIFNRVNTNPTVSKVSNINFFDSTLAGEPNSSVPGKVAIYNGTEDPNFSYFICGVGVPADENQCWNTDGKGGTTLRPTMKNVFYSGSMSNISGINFPYGGP
jgi:hypothetical protein